MAARVVVRSPRPISSPSPMRVSDLPPLVDEPDTIPLDPMRRIHVVTTRTRAPSVRDLANAANVLCDGALAFVVEWRAASRETKIALATMLIACALTWTLVLSLAR